MGGVVNLLRCRWSADVDPRGEARRGDAGGERGRPTSRGRGHKRPFGFGRLWHRPGTGPAAGSR